MTIRGLLHSRLFWAVGTAAAALLLFLAFGVFGVQTLFYNSEANEDFAGGAPASGEQASDGSMAGQSTAAPGLVSAGQFHPVVHPGSDDALVYRMEDGSHVLRLENLDIFNGPALYVYAVAADDASDSNTVLDAGFLDLGPLKGNQGNQTYELPAGFDPAKYRAISIWCQRFSVSFATAPLQ